MPQRSSGGFKALLFLLGILPLTLVSLAWADLRYWNQLIFVSSVLERVGLLDTVREDSLSFGDGGAAPPVQRLKQSILNVMVESCDADQIDSGTGFVVSPGYVATAAHVVDAHQECGKPIRLVDHRGIQHDAELTAFSDQPQLDLALLSFPETGLEALELADSSSYENAPEMVAVLTIGYPRAASTAEEAAVSGVGNISSFRNSLFFTSGMDLNPGNSGGPVFLEESWKVLGVAIQKGDSDSGTEGLGVVVPAESLAKFFEDRTGRRP